jgi:hypothetical protein
MIDISNMIFIVSIAQRLIYILMIHNMYFFDLREENWTDIMMLKSGAPIDRIDAYNLYLESYVNLHSADLLMNLDLSGHLH